MNVPAHPYGDNRKAKLSERFERCIRTFEGFEDIDSLLNGTASDMKRADYFILGRSVIIEQKTLTTNPEHKVQKYADQLLGEGKFDANGRHSLQPIFDGRSDGREHHRRLLYKLSAIVEGDISDADKQLRDTREMFSLPDAMGIVVLLNEGAHALDPQLTHFRVEGLLAEKAEQGAVRFPNTDLVIVIDDIHFLKAGRMHRRMGFYCSPTSPHREAAFRFAENLKDRWIGFCGEIYVGCVRPPPPGFAAKLYNRSRVQTRVC